MSLFTPSIPFASHSLTSPLLDALVTKTETLRQQNERLEQLNHLFRQQKKCSKCSTLMQLESEYTT